jgi:hypothetical protein
LADEDTKNKQTELTLKALRELGALTKGMAWRNQIGQITY